jgi:tetratricopeptide (TPR) repeat protein
VAPAMVRELWAYQWGRLMLAAGWLGWWLWFAWPVLLASLGGSLPEETLREFLAVTGLLLGALGLIRGPLRDGEPWAWGLAVAVTAVIDLPSAVISSWTTEAEGGLAARLGQLRPLGLGLLVLVLCGRAVFGWGGAPRQWAREGQVAALRAWRVVALGDWPLATQAAEAAIRAYPFQADHFRLLAQVQRGGGDPRLASLTFERGLRLHPEHEGLRVDQAIFRLAEGDPQSAAAMLASLLEDGVERSYIHYQYAQALVALGQRAEARRHARLAVEGDPANPDFQQLQEHLAAR